MSFNRLRNISPTSGRVRAVCRVPTATMVPGGLVLPWEKQGIKRISLGPGSIYRCRRRRRGAEKCSSCHHQHPHPHGIHALSPWRGSGCMITDIALPISCNVHRLSSQHSISYSGSTWLRPTLNRQVLVSASYLYPDPRTRNQPQNSRSTCYLDSPAALLKPYHQRHYLLQSISRTIAALGSCRTGGIPGYLVA